MVQVLVQDLKKKKKKKKKTRPSLFFPKIINTLTDDLISCLKTNERITGIVTRTILYIFYRCIPAWTNFSSCCYMTFLFGNDLRRGAIWQSARGIYYNIYTTQTQTQTHKHTQTHTHAHTHTHTITFDLPQSHNNWTDVTWSQRNSQFCSVLDACVKLTRLTL